ncbi:MAG: hypothetical protein HYV09_24115 [Deltaproteobacteria bacterium]|nr:hypothetical protein [Deltaproteobacteria bacterium]
MAVATAPPPTERRIDAARIRKAVVSLARTSGRVAGVVAVLAFARACFAGPPPPKTLDGLVQAIGSAARVTVRTNDFVWEASDGIVSDFARGRRILFLGAEKTGAPRDLYRARVRLSPEGRPLEVRDVVNLTQTPYGDEQGLVRDAAAERAAFATFAYGQLQGLTVLDLRGEGRASKAATAVERGMLWVTNLQETGDGAGIARIQVTIEKEVGSATLSFDGPTLVAQLAHTNGAVRVVKVDVDKADLVAPVEGVRAELLAQIPKKPIHWAVDTVRAVPWIGPEPIAWLEAKVWEWKDKLKRFKHDVASGHDPKDEVKSEAELVAPRVLDASAAGEDGGYWPPLQVPTIYKTPEPGEGQWVAVQPEWMHRIPGAPAPFYRTFVRPDPLRPYSKIILVAMDTRQLDFDMEAGVDDPKPTVGSFHGTGRIPRDVAVAKRTVAAFNGGFKTEHGHYGMMLKKRVLLPPVPSGATAVVTEDGRFGMGAWQPSREIPAEILSYRQNLDPLVEDGLLNPRGRTSWGAVLPGQPKLVGQQTERSGLCITKAHHTLYVWGDDVGPDALGKAMQLAGCDFGMHLDMNPYHTGFVFMSFHDAKFQTGKSETLTPLMAIGNRRYIDYNPKDFFFVMLRDPKPPSSAAIAWQADEGVQPPPKWMSGVWRAQATIKGETVSLTSFEPRRVRWALRAGTQEKADKGIAREVDGDDAKRVIAAIGFGVGDKRGQGLMIGGKLAQPMVAGEGALAVGPDGLLSITGAGESPIEGTVDVAQGTLLLDGGHLVEGHARAHGDLVRVGVGVTKDGRVMVARAKSSSDDAIAQALLDAGCVRAIAARGHADGFVHRAGTADAPMSGYPQTTLFAIAQPMLPRAFRFDRAADGKPRWPVVTKSIP